MKLLIIGAVSTLFSIQANAKQSCKDLKSQNFLAVYGVQQPLSGVLNQSLKKTGWTLDFNLRSAEPVITGEVQGTVESVVVGLVSRSIKKGWNINLTFDNADCTAYVDVLNASAPDTETKLYSKTFTQHKRGGHTIPIPAENSRAVYSSVISKNAYRVHKGELLRNVLVRWAKKHKGDSVWMVKDDKYQYPVGADAEFIGSLGGAVAGLYEAIGDEIKHLKISVYENSYIRVEEFSK